MPEGPTRADIEPRRDAATDEGSAIVEALLGATALLLERDGYDALTTNAIARVAGVSVGSLYQYFPSKRALVAALARDVERRGRAIASERAVEVDLTDARGVTRAFVSVLLDPRLGSLAARRALLTEVPPAWILEATKATDGSVEQLLVTMIDLLGPRLRPASPDVMAFVAFHAVEGVIEEALLFDPALARGAALVAELDRLVWRYVAPEGAIDDREPPLAPIGAWREEGESLSRRLVLEPSPAARDGAPRAQPSTPRGRRTVEAILAATVEVLGEGGWSAVSARAVAARAGVSAATLYRYFPDLYAVVAELARRREERTLARLAPLLAADDPLEHVAAGAIRALIAGAKEEHAVRHTLLAEVPFRHLRGVSTSVDATLREHVRRHVAARAPDVAALCAFVVAHAVERVVDAAVLRRPDLLERAELADELTTMALRYLSTG